MYIFSQELIRKSEAIGYFTNFSVIIISFLDCGYAKRKGMVVFADVMMMTVKMLIN